MSDPALKNKTNKKFKGRSVRKSSILDFSAVNVHIEMYSPGSCRRIHAQRGPACTPGHMLRGRERPYPGWLHGSLEWTCHDCRQNSPEILFYYKAKGRKRLDVYCLIDPETHISSRSLTKPIICKSVVFVYDFSFCNFSALLTKLHVNIIHAELVSFAVPGKEWRMIKSPRYAINTDLNLNPGSPTTIAGTSVLCL